MQEKFWFNRMVENWTIPQRLQLVEHVRRAGLHVVQAGTFGPMFYGLADDSEVARSWVGMPLPYTFSSQLRFSEENKAECGKTWPMRRNWFPNSNRPDFNSVKRHTLTVFSQSIGGIEK